MEPIEGKGRPRAQRRFVKRLATWLLSVGVVLGFANEAARARASTWLAREPLDAPSFSSGANPKVVVDASGDAIAVWSRRPESQAGAVVEASIRPPGSLWTHPVQLSSNAVSAEWPTVAVDRLGDLTVTWEAQESEAKAIEAAVKPAGGAWSNPVQLATNVGAFAGAPALAANAQGEVVVVWERELGSLDDVIESVRKGGAGEPWQPPEAVSVPGHAATSPYVGLDASGNAVAAWQRWGGECDEIEASVRPHAAVSWERPVALSPVGVAECDLPASVPRVAANPSGDAVVTWEKRTGEGDDAVEAAVGRTDRTAWLSPSTLSGAGAHEPRITLDVRGEAIATWERRIGLVETIEASAMPAGSCSWLPPATISLGRSPHIGEFPAVAEDAEGDAVVAWDQSNGTNYIVEASTRVGPTGNWSSPAALSAANENAYVPSVAEYPGGGAVAAWEVQGGGPSVEASLYEAGSMLSAAPTAPLPTTHRCEASATASPQPAPGSTSLRRAPLRLRGAHLTRRSFRAGAESTARLASSIPRGTSFEFSLSARASVFITIESVALHARQHRRALFTLTRLREPRGRDAIRFTGRVGRRALRPGRYAAVLSARNATGRSNRATLYFTVVP